MILNQATNAVCRSIWQPPLAHRDFLHQLTSAQLEIHSLCGSLEQKKYIKKGICRCRTVPHTSRIHSTVVTQSGGTGLASSPKALSLWFPNVVYTFELHGYSFLRPQVSGKCLMLRHVTTSSD